MIPVKLVGSHSGRVYRLDKAAGEIHIVGSNPTLTTSLIKMLNKILLDIQTVVDNRTWNMYTVEYETPDGTFSFYIYAISDEHASYLVEELKQTAKLAGKIEGFVKNNS